MEISNKGNVEGYQPFTQLPSPTEELLAERDALDEKIQALDSKLLMQTKQTPEDINARKSLMLKRNFKSRDIISKGLIYSEMAITRLNIVTDQFGRIPPQERYLISNIQKELNRVNSELDWRDKNIQRDDEDNTKIIQRGAQGKLTGILEQFENDNVRLLGRARRSFESMSSNVSDVSMDERSSNVSMDERFSLNSPSNAEYRMQVDSSESEEEDVSVSQAAISSAIEKASDASDTIVFEHLREAASIISSVNASRPKTASKLIEDAKQHLNKARAELDKGRIAADWRQTREMVYNDLVRALGNLSAS